MEEQKSDNVVIVKLEDYSPIISKSTQLYSTYEPEYIFAQLQSKLQDLDITPSLNKSKFKMTFDMVREQREEDV